MTTSDECCGWLSWAQLAGIGADGGRLNDAATSGLPPMAPQKGDVPFAVKESLVVEFYAR